MHSDPSRRTMGIPRESMDGPGRRVQTAVPIIRPLPSFEDRLARLAEADEAINLSALGQDQKPGDELFFPYGFI